MCWSRPFAGNIQHFIGKRSTSCQNTLSLSEPAWVSCDERFFMLTTTTMLLDNIFDPAKGWGYSANQVPLKRVLSSDGNVNYSVTVDEHIIMVCEQREWKEGSTSRVPANRMVAKVYLTGLEITDASVFLRASAGSSGLPAWGIDADGDLTLQTAFPITDDFPIEWARKQLLVCMGLLAEATQEFLAQLNETDSNDSSNRQHLLQQGGDGFDWDSAKQMASVAGEFLRAFLR